MGAFVDSRGDDVLVVIFREAQDFANLFQPFGCTCHAATVLIDARIVPQ